MAENIKTENTNVELREEIIAQLVESGMTIEEAEKVYKEQFEVNNGTVKLPFSLLKFNNIAGIADIGDLVAEPEKTEDGDVISYGVVYKPADIDFLVVNRKAMYSAFDPETSTISVKTKLQDTYAKKHSFVDIISGKTIDQLTTLDPKYQVLATVGVRPKGTNEPFTFYNIYLKGATLYGVNQLLDKVKESPYVLLNLVTKVGKKGAVRFTEVVLDESEARALPKPELLTNLSALIEANNTFNKYVTELNAEYDKQLPGATQVAQQSSDELPE
jgi:hypothetical protein